jgi:SNF2-related domain
MRDLYPHQQTALAYANTRDRVALFMEMRLGKTPVAVRWAASRPKARRVLVIAPLATLPGLGWERELELEGITHIIPLYEIPTKRRTAATLYPGWFLINYEGLRVCPELTLVNWDAVILDESTRIRNPRSATSKLVIRGFKHVPYRAVLTGLPNPESSLDYFQQISFLHGEFLRCTSYWDFRQRYFHSGWATWDWVPNTGTRDKIHAEVQRLAFVLTRKQAGVGPRKVHEHRLVEMTPEQKRLQKEIRKRFAVGDTETKYVVATQTWLSRLAGGFHPVRPTECLSTAKMRELTGLLETELAGQPVVVWFRFNNELRAVYEYLQAWHPHGRKPLTVVGVTGNCSKDERTAAQVGFRDGRYTVLLLQIKLAKFGWDLKTADTAVYYSNTYDYEDRSQSEDRIVSVQKTHSVLYVDLVTKGSLDEEVAEAVRDKGMEARLFQQRLASATTRLLAKGL